MDVILWTFHNHDCDDHWALRSAVFAHLFYRHVDEALVLVVLADLVQVLFQLNFIKPAGLIHEIDDRPAAGFHLLTQCCSLNMRVALKPDLAYCASDALVHRENDTRRAAFLVDWIHAEFNADVVVSMPLVNFDDFLARLLECLLVNGMIELHLDHFAQSFRFDPFRAGDFDFAHDRPRLNGNDHFHPVALRLSKDSNVSNVTGFVQCLDVLHHDFVRIHLANFCAHLRQNPFFADRGGACVFHLHGADDRRSRSRWRRLRPGNYGRKERTKRGDPNRNWRGAHPSTKTLHMSEAQPYATQTDAGQAAISEIRPRSSRRDFSPNRRGSASCSVRTSQPVKQDPADLSRSSSQRDFLVNLMVKPCTAAISASSPFSIGASLTAFQYSPSTKILPSRESIGVSAVTVLPINVSFPTFTGNSCARSPFPITNTKNAAVTSVAGMMKFNDKRKSGSARSNSMSEPTRNAMIPPTVSTPCVGVYRSNMKSIIASAIKTSPATLTGRIAAR